MNVKISVFVICAEVIIYFLLHNLHDCTFNLLGSFPISVIDSINTLMIYQVMEL